MTKWKTLAEARVLERRAYLDTKIGIKSRLRRSGVAAISYIVPFWLCPLASSETFLVEVRGHSLEEDGINDGDLLIVDPAGTDESADIAISDGQVVLAVVKGMTTVKRAHWSVGVLSLSDLRTGESGVTVRPSEIKVYGIVMASLTRSLFDPEWKGIDHA